jgi:hypothetical protein
MCDIWRSFVAQRCLWELGCGVVFHAPEVWQQRNAHDLIRDFTDEVGGYLRNKELAGLLTKLKLETGPGTQGSNLLSCYETLTSAGFFPEDELALVELWLRDVEDLNCRDPLSE